MTLWRRIWCSWRRPFFFRFSSPWDDEMKGVLDGNGTHITHIHFRQHGGLKTLFRGSLERSI